MKGKFALGPLNFAKCRDRFKLPFSTGVAVAIGVGVVAVIVVSRDSLRIDCNS